MVDERTEKTAEKPTEQEEQLFLEKAVKEEASSYTEGKSILLVIGIIVGLFALAFGGFTLYNNFTSATVLNIDDLHVKNVEGELDEEEGYVYNGYSFVKADGLWWTEMDKFNTLLKIPLHFGPRDVENVTVTGTLNPAFNDGDKVYLAIDPSVQNKYYTLAVSELSFNVVKGLNREPVGSCTEEHWACDNRTLISCENNPNNLPVIELDLAGNAGIELSDTCIRLTGSNDYDIVRSVDRLLYQWYGVMG